MGSQRKNHKVFRKFSAVSDFVERFPLMILVKKTFRISLRNDDVLVKIFIVKTEYVRFFWWKYRIQCSIKNYSFYLHVSEKLNIVFCRANFPLQNLLPHISPYTHVSIITAKSASISRFPGRFIVIWSTIAFWKIAIRSSELMIFLRMRI